MSFSIYLIHITVMNIVNSYASYRVNASQVSVVVFLCSNSHIYQVLIIYYLIFVMAICIAISYALSVLFEVGNGDVSKLENTRMHLS